MHRLLLHRARTPSALGRQVLFSSSSSLHSSTRRSAPPGISNEPCRLTVDALAGISDTVVMYLHHAKVGEELDSLYELPLATKWRRMTEALIKIQLHVIMPFGYTADVAGMQTFARNVQTLLSSSRSPSELEMLNDLRNSNDETWKIMLSRAFRVANPKWIKPEEARAVSLTVSNCLQSQETLDKASKFGNPPSLSSMSVEARQKAMDEFHEHVSIPCFFNAMAQRGMKKDDQTFAIVQASLQVLSANDGLIGQNLNAGMSAIAERAALLRG